MPIEPTILGFTAPLRDALGRFDAEWWALLGARLLLVAAVLIATAALLAVLKRLLQELQESRNLPEAVMLPVRRAVRWTILILAFVLALQLAGFSVTTLWATLSAVLALIAVGFIAVWSVLSNVACSLMLMIFKPFRIGDHIEICEKPEGPNIGGRVADVTLMYVVLQESGAGAATVQVPNNLFFQKMIRRRAAAHSVAIGDHVQRHGLAGRADESAAG